MGSRVQRLIVQKSWTIMTSEFGRMRRRLRDMIECCSGGPWVWKRILYSVQMRLVRPVRFTVKEVSISPISHLNFHGSLRLIANAPIVTCYVCHHRTCFTHQVAWHEGYTCDEWDKEKKVRETITTTAQYLATFTKTCPHCKKPVCSLLTFTIRIHTYFIAF